MQLPDHQPIIDCDVHAVVPDVQALVPYLSSYWRETIVQTGFKGAPYTWYPPKLPTSARPGSASADGPPGSDLALLREHLLDAYDVQLAILNCAYAIDSIPNPDAATALATAVNEWLAAEWLDHEPRLRASLVVPSHYPELAAREIARWGNHPGFVQVLLPAHSSMPYGNRNYHPIFAAATHHDLVVGIHFGGAAINPPTAVGWPSFYIEEYVGMAHVFQSQVISLVCEGVFDAFPALHVALLESGFTWLPSLMWRLDKEWKGLRREVPWVRRLPSEYIRDHIRVTTQPLDAPAEPDQMREVLEQIGSDDVLLFASDYPHWHIDTPEDVLPWNVLSDASRHKLLVENARTWYRL